MNTIGTKEAKDIVEMNGGIRVGSVVLKEVRYGYRILDKGDPVLDTAKIDTALDWMSDMGYLEETRFRLTAYQKNILRKRILEYIGTAIMGGFSIGMALIILYAYIFIG